MKTSRYVSSDIRPHWVGDGFPVRGLLGQHAFSPDVSPFLLLDYAGPASFEPTTRRRGVDAHPHKGFETVTIVYQGEVEHHDSTGRHGVIGPGDVQWMTAGSGILHKEYHSETFAKTGGAFEMIQLWVNLPANHKSAEPGYQPIRREDIPVVELENDSGRVRVIAGGFRDAEGAANTFTPMNVWDLHLRKGKSATFELPGGHTCVLVVRHGGVRVGGQHLGNASLAVLDPEDPVLRVAADADSDALLLTGEPLNEPIAAQGPFVMNTREELRQAMLDFQSGKWGRL